MLQGLSTVVLLGLSEYLIVHSVSEKHAEAAPALRIAALVFVVPGLLSAAAFYGLWRRRLWGWWLACICDWGITAVLVFAVIGDGWYMDNGWPRIDWSLVAFATSSLILTIWLLLPATRKFYWNTKL